MINYGHQEEAEHFIVRKEQTLSLFPHIRQNNWLHRWMIYTIHLDLYVMKCIQTKACAI